jgi:hypothetical protein
MPPIVLNGDTGITTPSYGGADTSEYLVPVTAFKNRIINGQMQIDQRNAGASKSYSAATIAYTVDRFFLYPSGAAVTGQQVVGTNTGTQYAFRITGATGSTACNFSQRVENLNATDLNSVAVTISFKAYASTAISNLAISAFCGTSANSGYGGGNNVTSSTFSLASGLNTITQTITMPSTASNGFELAIAFNSGIGNSVTVDISSVQLEKGSTATSFDYRPYGTELALCQRYYYRIVAGNAGQIFGTSYNSTTSTALVSTPFPVTLRTNPTAIEKSGTAGDYRVNNLNTATTCTSVPAFNNASQYFAFTTFTTGATLTAGQASAGSCVNTNAYLGWNAEL